MNRYNRILLLLTAIFFISCSRDRISETSSIPNGDFELWSQNLLLSDWLTNSCPECDPPFETYVVQRDSSSYHGKYAAKFIYNNVYAAWAENNFALRKHPLFIGGYVKCQLVQGDTVSIKCWLYHDRIAVDSGEWIGTASISEYEHRSLQITQHVSEIDSARIRITGGHKAGVAGKNTEFWVDYLDLE